METYRVTLVPKSAISIYPGSDTLFGAIMWGIRELYGETILKKYLANFQKDRPPFILSSSFPVLNGKEKVFFFPRPVIKGLTADEIEAAGKKKVKPWGKKYLIGTIETYKTFKKAKYISQELFGRVLKGINEEILFDCYLTESIILNRIDEIEEEDYGGEIRLFSRFLMHEKEFVSLFGKEPKRVIANAVIMRNTIDRLTGSTAGEGQLFYTEETFAAPDCLSLYFLIRTEDDIMKELIPVLKYLADTGIGRDRSIGRNQFEILSPIEFEFPLSQEGNSFITLSRYIPKADEIDLPPQSPTYELLPIRAKVESRWEFAGEDIWKKPIIYFAEGSVLKPIKREEYYGWSPKVKSLKNQEILQNGFCLPAFGRLEV